MENKIIAIYTRQGYPSANVLQYIPNYAGTKVNTLIISGPNGDSSTGEIVYNNKPYTMFSAKGFYMGDENWPASLEQMASKTNIAPANIFLSLSTSAIIALAAMGDNLYNVMEWLKSNWIAGIDIDYEDGNPMQSQEVKTVTLAAIKAGLALTAAPYILHDGWMAWCEYVETNKGKVYWLNVQCYSGGASNNPVEWAKQFAPIPVVAGFEAKCSTSYDGGQLSPREAEYQLYNWQHNIPHASLAGAFVWDFGIVISPENTYKFTVEEYAESMFIGLTAGGPL